MLCFWIRWILFRFNGCQQFSVDAFLIVRFDGCCLLGSTGADFLDDMGAGLLASDGCWNFDLRGAEILI